MASNLQKSSILFNRVKQVLVKPRMKSTLVYEVDKTAAQRFMEGRIAKLKETQNFHAVRNIIWKKLSKKNILRLIYKLHLLLLKADDGLPLWWKSPADKALTTFVFAATIGGFVASVTNCYKFATGTFWNTLISICCKTQLYYYDSILIIYLKLTWKIK